MLYENIFLDSADSAYVSKEISVMSPNQEKDLSAISQHDTTFPQSLENDLYPFCHTHQVNNSDQF